MGQAQGDFARMALAFNSMRRRPDPGLAAAMQGRIDQRRAAAEQARMASEQDQQRNATVEYLMRQAETRGDPQLRQLAEMYQMGLVGNEAIAGALMPQDTKPNWQWNDDLGRYVDVNSLTPEMAQELSAGSGGITDEVRDIEGGLRDEFASNPAVKDFENIASSWRRILEVGSQGTPAGDMALIFSYMKMLDPGSTVREGEYASAANAASVPERIRRMYNQTLTGEGLTEDMRADFMKQAENAYNSQVARYKGLQDRFSGLATEYGGDPSRVIDDARVVRPAAPNASARPMARPGNPLARPDIPMEGAMTFEQFKASPAVQQAARQAGVTIEEMWEIHQGGQQ